ncbi:MAG: response regulator [Candidatus Omnitrophica bacterium]|nr:response regulator [Candidatus Omnitrophota bacterium]
MVKLLVVDDEPAVVSLLERFLTDKGYRVLTATSGTGALGIFDKERPRIVFLDIRMPGMDGLEVLRTMKQQDRRIKVIMITVVEDQETIDLARGLGADEYIVKPFDLEYLEKVVIHKVSELVDEEE